MRVEKGGPREKVIYIYREATAMGTRHQRREGGMLSFFGVHVP